MKLLFHPSNSVHVLSALEIRRGLAEQEDVELHGFHLDDWYGLAAGDALAEHAVPFTHFPRREAGNETVPVWQEESPAAIAAAWPAFERAFASTLDAFRPDVFVLFVDHAVFSVGMLRQCRRAGVPTLLVQEGFLPHTARTPAPFGERLRAFLKRQLKRQLRRVRPRRTAPPDPSAAVLPPTRPMGLNGADAMTALNAEDRDWFVRRGVPAERITVTGHPLMDRLWRHLQETADARPAANEKRLLVVSTGMSHFGREDLHRWYVCQVREVAEALAEALAETYRFDLRLKPGESIGDWERVWPDLREHVRLVPSDGGLYEQVRAVDGVVVGNSQVMIEAFLLGRAVFNLIPAQLREPYRLAERGAIREARSAAELRAALAAQDALVLRDEQVRAGRACYEEFFDRFDGRAGARVADVLCKLVNASEQVDSEQVDNIALGTPEDERSGDQEHQHQGDR